MRSLLIDQVMRFMQDMSMHVVMEQVGGALASKVGGAPQQRRAQLIQIMNGDTRQPVRARSSIDIEYLSKKRPGTGELQMRRMTSSRSTIAELGDPHRPKISLHHAVRDNRNDIIAVWLSNSDTHINERDSSGYAPLHYAAKFNRHSILKELVDAGADPHVVTKEESFTPLHFAARYTPRLVNEEAQQQQDLNTDEGDTSTKTVEFLVTKSEINAKAQFGLTPLHLACQRGNVGAVDILLKSENIDASIIDSNEDTPLHEACLNGHCNIVQKLLSHIGPENLEAINHKNLESKTPLHLACHEGHTEVVRMLLDHVDEKLRKILVRTEDKEGNTALHLACESGEVRNIRLLMAKGADVTSLKMDDVAPIHIAARYGFIEIANELLTTGENILDIVDNSNRTPLHYAAAQNKLEMITFLLDHGASLTATDMESYTPLMLAAAAGHTDAFNILLARGSAIDDVDNDGQTVLHLAAKENHTKVLQATLQNEKGYKLVNSTDSSYNTALHLAASEGNIDAVQELLRSTKRRIKMDARNELKKTPTHLAATKGHVHVLQVLLRHKRECILDEDEDVNTPLHLAALNGHHKSAKVLLDYQADFHSRNGSLWTPMNCAAYNGNEKVVDVLIEAGAEVNPSDQLSTMCTPLQLAAQEGHLNVVKVLLENHADAGRLCKGLNSLDVAIDNGHREIAYQIIKSEQWIKALRNTSQCPLGKISTPMRKLIKKMPDVAEEVFNHCCSGSDVKDSKARQNKDFTISFNYEFIEDFQDDKHRSFCSKLFRRKITEMPLHHDSGNHDECDGDRSLDSEQTPHDNCPPPWGPVGFTKKLHPLSIMVDHNRTNLLKHPLVTSLLNLKWTTYGRKAYLTNLLIFAFFVTLLTSFALVSLNPQSDTCVTIFNGDFRNAISDMVIYNIEADECVVVNASQDYLATMTAEEVCTNPVLQQRCGVSDLSCGRCDGQSQADRNFLIIAASFIMLIATVRLAFEAYQLISLKLYYLLDWVNWIEVILLACSIVFVSVYNTHCLCPTRWQWQIGCISVFLTWVDLVVFIQKIPFVGIYVLMFVHIFYTFCKMSMLIILLILSFSIAFYMTFYDPSEEFSRSSFATPGRAILTTMTMTTGDFEYDAIFRQHTAGLASEDVTREIPFFPVSYLLWMFFLVLMPILLTNLLVGLAVDDIKGIQDAAVLKRLALQVELVLSVEYLLPTRLRRYFIKEEQTIKPNRKLNILEKLRYEYYASDESRHFDSQEYISSALHPQPTPVEQIQQQTRNLELDVKKIKDSTSDQAERIMAMEKLLQKMAEKLRVTDDEEEVCLGVRNR